MFTPLLLEPLCPKDTLLSLQSWLWAPPPCRHRRGGTLVSKKGTGGRSTAGDGSLASPDRRNQGRRGSRASSQEPGVALASV